MPYLFFLLKKTKKEMENIPLLEGLDTELDIEMVSVMYLYMPHFLPCFSHLWYICVGYLPGELKCYHIGEIFI